MKTGTFFQPAKKTDLELLLVLMDEYYRLDHLLFDQPKARRALQTLLQDRSLGRVWLIRRSSEFVGYFTLTFGFIVEFHGRHAVLDEFYLRAPHRGKGIGRRTLRFIENFCRSMDIHVVRLEVEKDNVRAQKFYRTAKFIPHERILMTKLLKKKSSNPNRTRSST